MITFRLAMSEADFAACRALAATYDQPTELEHPTVMAETPDGALAGVLGTTTTHGVVEAAPLCLGPVQANRGIVVKRMINHYDKVLYGLGIVQYYFYVKHGTRWHIAVERVAEHYNTPDPYGSWYLRKVA